MQRGRLQHEQVFPLRFTTQVTCFTSTKSTNTDALRKCMWTLVRAAEMSKEDAKVEEARKLHNYIATQELHSFEAAGVSICTDFNCFTSAKIQTVTRRWSGQATA